MMMVVMTIYRTDADNDEGDNVMAMALMNTTTASGCIRLCSAKCYAHLAMAYGML